MNNDAAEDRFAVHEVKKINALLLYPRFPDTFWSFRHAIRFISKRSVHPPLGLLTIAAMLPAVWEKRLIDENVSSLKDVDLDWADLVFISAMAVQRKSVESVLMRCREKGVKVVAGGPLFTASSSDFPDVDYLVLNEAESTLPRFLRDFLQNRAKKIYRSRVHPDLSSTPVPQWDLINLNRYASMDIQYSRGCPHMCDFCDITAQFGRKVRTKSALQILNELHSLYELGWRGNIFFVDDNFIGNRKKLKTEILPPLISWMESMKHPFAFSTEATITLADDEQLMDMMSRAGFNCVFIGIETPNENSLAECRKAQNQGRDLLKCVKRIQAHGFEVTGGFIVGFDSDSPGIFPRQIDFIRKTSIVTAMVGLLNAPKNTALYRRLKSENRLLKDVSGDNTDFTINFVPKMNFQTLIEGYRLIIRELYSVKPYYARVKQYLSEKKCIIGHMKKPYRFRPAHVVALIKSAVLLGIKDKGRSSFWSLFIWSLFKCPRCFSDAVTYSIYGYHFRRVFGL